MSDFEMENESYSQWVNDNFEVLDDEDGLDYEIPAVRDSFGCNPDIEKSYISGIDDASFTAKNGSVIEQDERLIPETAANNFENKSALLFLDNTSATEEIYASTIPKKKLCTFNGNESNALMKLAVYTSDTSKENESIVVENSITDSDEPQSISHESIHSGNPVGTLPIINIRSPLSSFKKSPKVVSVIVDNQLKFYTESGDDISDLETNQEDIARNKSSDHESECKSPQEESLGENDFPKEKSNKRKALKQMVNSKAKKEKSTKMLKVKKKDIYYLNPPAKIGNSKKNKVSLKLNSTDSGSDDFVVSKTSHSNFEDSDIDSEYEPSSDENTSPEVSADELSNEEDYVKEKSGTLEQSAILRVESKKETPTKKVTKKRISHLIPSKEILSNQNAIVINSKFHKEGLSAIPPTKTFIPASIQGGANYYKQNFCCFCLTLCNRIDRHLIIHHGEQSEVKNISSLPPRSLERRRKIGLLRNRGNEIYNKSNELNPTGEQIVSRRTRANKENKCEANVTKSKGEKIICIYCRGYFNEAYLSSHIQNIHKDIKVGNDRQVKRNAITAMDQVHERATELVRDEVLLGLLKDECGNVVRYDLLIILFANKFSQKKDGSKDQYAQLRSNLRLLAKLALAIKYYNKSLTQLHMSFRAMHWPTMLKAIYLICEYKKETRLFDNPYNGETLPILLRKCIRILRHEFEVQEDKVSQERLTGFVNVFEGDIDTSVSAIADRSRKAKSRHRPVETLPQSHEIAILKTYLEKKRILFTNLLKESNGNPAEGVWMELIKVIGLLIQIFNRRRSGEISKTLILDYENARAVDKNSEFYQSLTEDEKMQRNKYVRIDIQGKRIDGKGSLYISQEIVESIDLILLYRKFFKVSDKNRYLFGIPTFNGSVENHIDLCKAMNQYAEECDKKHKSIDTKNMRGTKLRKHLATFNSTKNKDNVSLISTHLGHSLKVHNNVYKQTVDGDDAAITKVLESAIQNSDDNEMINDTAEIDISKAKQIKLPQFRTNASESEFDEKENGKGKKKQPIKRKSWSLEEIIAFEDAFADHLENQTYPTSKEITAAHKKFNILQARSAHKIRARFSNIFRKEAEREK